MKFCYHRPVLPGHRSGPALLLRQFEPVAVAEGPKSKTFMASIKICIRMNRLSSIPHAEQSDSVPIAGSVHVGHFVAR